MTIFSDNPYDRRMERLMMTVPNFAPRGVGFRFTEAQVFITTTAATPTEILAATMRQIRCPPFRKRLLVCCRSISFRFIYLFNAFTGSNVFRIATDIFSILRLQIFEFCNEP